MNLDHESVKGMWKGLTPPVLIVLIMGAAMFYIQQARFEQHMTDYEAITSSRIGKLHTDMTRLTIEVVDLKIQYAELRTHFVHVEEHLASLEKKIDRLLNQGWRQ